MYVSRAAQTRATVVGRTLGAVPRRTAAQAAETRTSLIRAARRLFEKHGYEAVSAEQVVRAARVTRGAMYHHFTDKEHLFREVVVAMMRELHDLLETTGIAPRDPLDHLERGVRGYLDLLAEPGPQRVLLVDAPVVLGWHAWRALDLRFGLGVLHKALSDAVAGGQLAVHDVDVASHLLAGALIDGAMLIGRKPHDRVLRRRVVATALQLVHGLATPRARSRS
jgi:AcrR family transcriptional regulator